MLTLSCATCGRRWTIPPAPGRRPIACACRARRDGAPSARQAPSADAWRVHRAAEAPPELATALVGERRR